MVGFKRRACQEQHQRLKKLLLAHLALRWRLLLGPPWCFLTQNVDSRRRSFTWSSLVDLRNPAFWLAESYALFYRNPFILWQRKIPFFRGYLSSFWSCDGAPRVMEGWYALSRHRKGRLTWQKHSICNSRLWASLTTHLFGDKGKSSFFRGYLSSFWGCYGGP